MKERIKSLDALRGIAALIIAFVGHQLYFPNIHLIRTFKAYSFYFVELFVCISGFAIASNYKEKIKSTSFKEYIFKRIRRLYPLYWLTEFLALSLQLVSYKKMGHFLFDAQIDLFHVLSNFLGISCGWIIASNPSNGPAWTIHVLMLCYIFYYFIARLSIRSNEKYLQALIITAFFCVTGLFWRWNYSFIYHDNTLRCLFSFCIGCFLNELYSHLNKSSQRNDLQLVWGGVCIIFIIILAISLALAYVLGIDAFFGETRIVVIAFICPILVLSSIYVKAIRSLLESQLFLFLGKISFSVYLWHWVILLLMVIIDGNFLATPFGAALYSLISLFIATFSNLFLEKRLDTAFMFAKEKLLGD